MAYGTSNGTDPLWVAVGYDDGANKQENILWSEDGKEWQVSTGVSFSTQGQGVAYGTSNGRDPLWVAVGDDSIDQENILWSENGKEWQVSTGVSFNKQGNGVAYGTSNGTDPLWVAVGYDDANDQENILWSEDGKEWQVSAGVSFDYRGFGVAYGTSNGTGTDPLWVAVGYGANKEENILWSENGKEWQVSTGVSIISGQDVAYGTSNGRDPLWVAVCTAVNGANKQENILWSENGKEWQVSTGVSFEVQGNGVAYGTADDGTTPLWVAVGQDNNQENILWSENGKEWQVSTGVSFNQLGNGAASDLLNPALKGKSAAPPF